MDSIGNVKLKSKKGIGSIQKGPGIGDVQFVKSDMQIKRPVILKKENE